MMAAGNMMTDKAIVNRISTAMQSRLIHFEIAVDQKSWIKWADVNDIDHRVKSYVNFSPDSLHKFDPNHNEETVPCPRTWEVTSLLIDPYPDLPHRKIALLAGAIGEGMARSFFSYSQIYTKIPTIEDIKRNPEGVTFGDEPSIHFALSGLIGHHLSDKNAGNLMKFLVRLNVDFQVLALRSAIARNSEVKKTDAVKSWITRNSKELM